MALTGCAIDNPIDYTTEGSGETTNEVVVYSEFAGVFTQDEADTNTERRIRFSTEEAIEQNKEYVVTIDGDEFKYTTTASTDHQSLASQFAQAIDGNSKYTATVQNNVIKIHTGAGTSSISATKTGALTEISEEPPTEALTVENPADIDVGFYYANSSSRTTRLNAIKAFYNNDMGLTTTDFNNRFNGTDLNVSLLIIMQPPTAFNQTEINTLIDHLDKGRRIFFIGEFNGVNHEDDYASKNTNISNLLTDIGGSISVLGGAYGGTFNTNKHDNVFPKNLNNSKLNSGVNSFQTTYYAELSIDPKISQAIIVDDAGRIVVADQALSKGRVTLIADHNWIDGDFTGHSCCRDTNADNKVFLRNLAIDSYENEKLVSEGINPNENFAPVAGTVETIFTSVATFNIVGQTLTINSTNEKIGKEIQFESRSDSVNTVEFKDEKLFVTYKKGVSTTQEIVALINAYPEFAATTTGNIIIP